MATHDFHQELNGYDDRQIWVDGCKECESRADSLPLSITSLDNGCFRAAWVRAQAMNQGQDVGRISKAESALLNTLNYVRIAQERSEKEAS